MNQGNLIIRHAFLDTGQIDTLRRLVNKALSTTYAMTEEVGEYQSGTPSPLHVVAAIVEELYHLGKKLGWEINHAQAVAQYPLIFLKQLSGEVVPESDAIAKKLDLLLKSAADANYLLTGRTLKELNLGELRQFSQFLQSAAILAPELAYAADDRITVLDSEYKGVPIQRENGSTGR